METHEFDLYDEPRLHMERLLQTKLVEFDLPLVILLPLEKSGIITLGDLTGKTYNSLMRINNLGVGRIGRLVSLLESLDLKLATK